MTLYPERLHQYPLGSDIKICQAFNLEIYYLETPSGACLSAKHHFEIRHINPPAVANTALRIQIVYPHRTTRSNSPLSLIETIWDYTAQNIPQALGLDSSAIPYPHMGHAAAILSKVI